jgi:group I intron endonuclease
MTTKRMYSTTGKNNKINPEVVYSNFSDRERIIQENKDKSGIYRWTNKLSGKSYVGSSINLSKRFNQYFSPKLLSNRRYISLIYQALLKYKFENFRLEILEYCDKESVICREQFYLDLLKPKYNIYLKAGSPMGFKHSEKSRAIMKTLAEKRRHSKETRMKIGASLKGRVLLAETLVKMVNNRAGYKHSEATKEKLRAKVLGRKFSQETKDKMAVSHFGHQLSEETIAKLKKFSYTKEAVEIVDTVTGLTNSYESKTEAAKAMGVSMPTISNYIKSKKLFKKRYHIVCQVRLAGADLEKSPNFRKTPVEVLDTETGIKTTYGSKAEAGEALGVTTATLRKYIKSQELLKNRFKLN